MSSFRILAKFSSMPYFRGIMGKYSYALMATSVNNAHDGHKCK